MRKDGKRWEKMGKGEKRWEKMAMMQKDAKRRKKMQKDAKRCKAQLGVGSEDSGPRSDTINRLMFNVLPDRTDVTMNCVHELYWIEDRLQSQEHLLLPVSVEPVEPMSL